MSSSGGEEAAASANANDPSGFLPNGPPSGAQASASSLTFVKVVGTARDDMNDKIGYVASYAADRGRYVVVMLSPGTVSPAASAASARSGQQPAVLSFKPENLVRASFMERTKVQLQLASEKVKELIANPEIRSQVARAYGRLDSALPGPVKPEYMGILLLVLFFLSVRFFGFSRVFLLSSFLGLILMVSAPDIWFALSSSTAGVSANLRTIVRNFPSRWKEQLVQLVGLRSVINETVGLAIFVVFLAITVRALMYSAPSAAKTPSPPVAAPPVTADSPADSPVPPVAGTPNSTTESIVTSFSIDDIYKMGFNDATESKAYGSSLPSVSELGGDGVEDLLHARIILGEAPPKTKKPGGVDSEFDEISWSNPPPAPSSEKKSKFGISTILAGLALGRTIQEIAFDPNGNFNSQLAMMNFQAMPIWRKAVMGLCLYNIVSVFF